MKKQWILHKSVIFSNSLKILCEGVVLIKRIEMMRIV